jgi:hypothetical protein
VSRGVGIDVGTTESSLGALRFDMIQRNVGIRGRVTEKNKFAPLTHLLGSTSGMMSGSMLVCMSA